MNLQNPVRSRFQSICFSIGLVFCLSAILGCREDSPDCDLIGAPARPMFEVTVIDSLTGDPAWWGVLCSITDGDFREDLSPTSTNAADSLSRRTLYSSAFRVGVYTLVVEKPGYQRWQSSGLAVVEQGCALTSHTIEARLQRLSP